MSSSASANVTNALRYWVTWAGVPTAANLDICWICCRQAMARWQRVSSSGMRRFQDAACSPAPGTNTKFATHPPVAAVMSAKHRAWVERDPNPGDAAVLHMAPVDDRGLDPVWWTFLMRRAETRENVHDDSASETLIYARIQSTHG